MKIIIGIIFAISIVLTGCGGTGGEGGSFFGGTLSFITTNVPITVINGPIKNATVFLDKNLNGVCDPGEPSGITDANGLVNLSVNNGDLGKFPVVAIVDTNALDRDTGPVSTRYVMKAPADAYAVISPLTTMVQAQVETFGLTTAQATTSVAGITGLNPAQLSTDYTKDNSAAGASAYSIAQAIVVATQKQTDTAKSAIGSGAIDGTIITQTNLDRAVYTASATMLSGIISNMNSSNAISSISAPSDRLIALQKLVTNDFIKDNGGISSAGSAQVAIGIQIAAVSQASNTTTGYTPVATASLANLQFTDLNNWNARISVKTLAEATVDSNNTYRYRWARYKNYGGGPVAWGAIGNSPARGADFHWNGANWVNCLINHQNIQTAYDSVGIGSYNFCDGLSTGVVIAYAATSATFDVSGLSMNNVYLDKIAAANYTNIKIGDGTIQSVNSYLGSALFPSGSKLIYFTDVSKVNAASYYPSSGNPGFDNTVIMPSSVDSGGGDFTSGVAQTACLNNTASNAPAKKLEDLIALNLGTPCKFSAGTAKGFDGATLSSTEGGQSRNENWGWTTLSMGTLGSEKVPGSLSTATSYYTGNTALRVAFAPNFVAKFYTCKQRYDYAIRNCDFLTSGKYSINQLIDGSRTLTFTGLPSVAAGLGWQRVFVERNNLIYWGYQDLPKTSISARLNKVAMDALFVQLGLNNVSYFNGLNGGIDPASKIVLNGLAYGGDYKGAILSDGYISGSFTATIGLDGRNTCSGFRPYKSPATSGESFICNVEVSPGAEDSTIAKFSIRMGSTVGSGTLNYYTGAISDGTWSDKSLMPSTGAITGNRL